MGIFLEVKNETNGNHEYGFNICYMSDVYHQSWDQSGGTVTVRAGVRGGMDMHELREITTQRAKGLPPGSQVFLKHEDILIRFRIEETRNGLKVLIGIRPPHRVLTIKDRRPFRYFIRREEEDD